MGSPLKALLADETKDSDLQTELTALWGSYWVDGKDEVLVVGGFPEVFLLLPTFGEFVVLLGNLSLSTFVFYFLFGGSSASLFFCCEF